jgi:hypothetical protein
VPHIIEHDVNVVVSPNTGKGAFTPNVNSVLSENLGGILGGMYC